MPCGYVFDLITIPCADEYQLLPESLCDELADRSPLKPEQVYEILDRGGPVVLWCRNRPRLWIEIVRGDRPCFEAYVREATDPVRSAHQPHRSTIHHSGR